MNKKYLLITGLALILFVSAFTLAGTIQVGAQNAYGVSFNLSESAFLKLMGAFLEQELDTEKTEKEVSLAAAPAADRFWPVTCENGVCTGHVQSNLLTATSSVPCIIRSPFAHSTSTLEFFSLDIRGRGLLTVAQEIDISTTTGTGGYGSSSPSLARYELGADTNDQIVWSPRYIATSSAANGDLLTGNFYLDSERTTGDSRFLIGPNEYVTARIASSSLGVVTSGFVGSCRAEFKEI